MRARVGAGSGSGAGLGAGERADAGEHAGAGVGAPFGIGVSAWAVLCLFLELLLPGRVTASSPEEIMNGVGQVPSSHMSMLFEVTFFGLDVATVDAFLTDSDAAKVAAVLSAAEDDLGREVRDQIREVLLQADPCVIRMTLLRDASWERYLKATQRNLRHAYEADLLTEEDYQRLETEFVTDFASLEARGVKEGDAVYYRTDGDRVRISFFDVDGNELEATDRSGELRAEGILASYFGPKSDFSEKLIRSLEKKGDQ